MKCKGLTLMELLIVISTLVTLSALFFPVYLSVRERVYVLSCVDQLRQIGLAMHMYALDQGDGTPYSLPSMDFGKFFGMNKSIKGITGIPALYPNYLKDKNLLSCPLLRKVAFDAVEEAHRLHEKLTYQFYGVRYPWTSYYLFDPFALDELAKEDPTGLSLSFSEIFAKRGDQIPIAFCDIHQNGRPDYDNFYPFIPNARFLPPNPNAPLIILRWNGVVSLVYRRLASTQLILMTY